jgi:hypothetical protein
MLGFWVLGFWVLGIWCWVFGVDLAKNRTPNTKYQKPNTQVLKNPSTKGPKTVSLKHEEATPTQVSPLPVG